MTEETLTSIGARDRVKNRTHIPEDYGGSNKNTFGLKIKHQEEMIEMKKHVLFFIVALVLLTFSAGNAQVKPGAVTVSPTIGGYMFEGNEDMDNSLSLGLRAGYNFTKYIGIEGFVHYVPTEIRQTGAKEKINFLGYGIEGIFHILPDGPLVPFVAAGVGGVHYSASYDYTTEDKNNKIAVDYGAGVKYFLTDNFALRADVRHVIPFDGAHNNLLYTVGLSFSFGGSKKAPVTEKTAASAVVEEVKPQPAAHVIVEEVKPRPTAPVIVEEVKPQSAVAKEIVEKGRATLNVLFATNKDNIKKNYFKDIDDLAAVMKQYPDLNVTIEGHTDNVGSAAYNKKLSQKRADAVKKYMVKKAGIDAKRLTAKGFGLERPVASNSTKEGRAKNRRVEAAVDYIIKK